MSAVIGRCDICWTILRDGVSWTAMPASLTFIFNQTRLVAPCDLTLNTECKILAVAGIDGNGSASPTILSVYLEKR